MCVALYIMYFTIHCYYITGHRYKINSTCDVYFDEEPKGKYAVAADGQQAYGELQDVRTVYVAILMHLSIQN